MNRNPSGLKPGDRVRVIGEGHRDFGKTGTIVQLEGVDDDTHGKPRAHISSGGLFIHVSLPNLVRDVK
jgi:hypothetical protein